MNLKIEQLVSYLTYLHWVFVHAADFTPVCTTELGKIALYAGEFNKRGVKLLGVSCDDVASHVEWIKDIEAYTVM